MIMYHEARPLIMNMPPKRVSESAPVQVYLDRQSQQRLEQLAGSLGASKSEVLRRGLLALEREVSDPSSHPILRMVGAVSDRLDELSYDVAREHDRFLATVSEPPPPLRPAARNKGHRRG